LGERVAHLHLRPLRLVLVGQLFGGERRAMDAVTAGARADGDDRVAGALRIRADQLVPAHVTDGHRIDERVAFIRVVEIDLAADVRDPDAVAVVADALDDTSEQPADARVRKRAEAERVEYGDGPRTHREDVAQDAADTG